MFIHSSILDGATVEYLCSNERATVDCVSESVHKIASVYGEKTINQSCDVQRWRNSVGVFANNVVGFLTGDQS